MIYSCSWQTRET